MVLDLVLAGWMLVRSLVGGLFGVALIKALMTSV